MITLGVRTSLFGSWLLSVEHLSSVSTFYGGVFSQLSVTDPSSSFGLSDFEFILTGSANVTQKYIFILIVVINLCCIFLKLIVTKLLGPELSLIQIAIVDG